MATVALWIPRPTHSSSSLPSCRSSRIWWRTKGKSSSLAAKDSSRSRSTQRRMRWCPSVTVTLTLWWLLGVTLTGQTPVGYALDSIDTVRSASPSSMESGGNEVDGTRVLFPEEDETDQPNLWGSASGATADITESSDLTATAAGTGGSTTSNVEVEMEPSDAFESKTVVEGDENDKRMKDHEQIAFTAPTVSTWKDLNEEGVFDDVLDVSRNGDPESSHPGRPLVVFQGSFQQTMDTLIPDDALNEKDSGSEKKVGDEDKLHRGADLSTKGEASSGATGKRLWGADHHLHSTQIKSPGETDTKESNDQQPPSAHFPYIKPKPFQALQHSQEQRHPPEGFALAARVYIDSNDNLAHFDYPESDSNHGPLYATERRCDIALPFFDCGALGSTTAALPVKHVHFRHMLTSTHTVWRDPQFRPVLAVALTPLRIELDSGEAQDFHAGDVILLEDSMQPGHQILASIGTATTSPDKSPSHVSILFVTLSKPHYHVGKQHLSLQNVIAKSTTPCRDMPVVRMDTNSTPDWDERNVVDKDGSQVDSSTTNKGQRPKPSSLDGVQQLRTPMVWNTRRFRMVALGTVSLSLSTLMADFLAKTAPLWLAVGIGGTCFVVGATYGLVVAGDYAFTAWDLWREQHRLEQTKRQRSEQF